MAGLAQFKQENLQFGLETDFNSPAAQRAQQFGEFEQAAQPLIGQAVAGADTRAANTLNQIKSAGLSGLANQFRRSQRDIAFDTARRGTIGGSRSIERNQQAQATAEAGIGGVLNSATSQANAQRNAELAPIYGFQQNLAQGDPMQQFGVQNQLQNINLQGQAAQGQFDFTSDLNNIRSASQMNRAGFIGSAIGNLGQLGGSYIDANSRQKQLAALRGLGA